MPKKIAVISTIFFKYSHTQHMADRILEGYGYLGRHYMPDLELVSMYVDQVKDNDLSRERSERFGFPIYPTIAEALTLGGDKLAVDGVLLIGEHGDYGRNDKGQHLYPRYKFFKEIEAVFRDSGRSVPVFNDKHLSYDWDEAVEMVDVSRELGFAFMSGSSLPVTWRLPALEFPLGVDLREAVCVCYGGVDSYDYHGLETIQCMVERRGDGEVGVKSIHAMRGNAVWDALDACAWDEDLMWGAIARSNTRKPQKEDRIDAYRDRDDLRKAVANPVAYVMEYNDGLKATNLLFSGFADDFNFAGRLGNGIIESCQMYLPMPPRHTTLASFFSPLMYNIEKMFHSGKATYPVERTLLTTGQTAFAVESLHEGEVKLETPQLAVEYRATEESHFWRA
ncbi:MAG: hypothetical protein O3A46_01570 [Candidatus Poribacteria bacterium]|nr:hypothetical protein [Candidatus Poribacteria bacterium]